MEFPFSDHVALLEQLLSGRQEIVQALERQLFGVKGKAVAQRGDRESIADVFSACFFESATISPRLSRLNGQLDAAHLADGFEPVRQDGYSRGLDPVELVLRACHYWDSTRWPGTNGRVVFAQGLYAVFMLRQLEHMSVRVWDGGPDRPSSIVQRPASNPDQAAERLRHVQRLLDLLNESGGSAHALPLVRDARWLIQTAQGPLTRHVRPYFIKAGHVSALPDEVRLEIHKAGAVLAGGHLRSQLRRLSRRTGWAFDDPQLLALTRSSNSMDMALLVRDLVPLLGAYIAASERQDGGARLGLADAILQGLSADPELLLTRWDLLGPSTMIEDLFVERGDAGAVSDTAIGVSHRECLARYCELVARTADSLLQDSRAFEPAHAPYSPLGIVYGFCADLVSNMVLNTLRSPSSPDLGLEDVFLSHGRLDDKQTQAHEWERLPKGDREGAPFEHSTEWAAQMGARLAAGLEARAARPVEPNASCVSTSSLYVVPRGVPLDAISDGVLPAGIVLAQEHCLTSDVTRARVTGATPLPADRLASDRSEGRLLACVYADGAWFGISKAPLTLYISQGKDAMMTDVPSGVIDLLHLVCAKLLIVVRNA